MLEVTHPLEKSLLGLATDNTGVARTFQKIGSIGQSAPERTGGSAPARRQRLSGSSEHRLRSPPTTWRNWATRQEMPEALGGGGGGMLALVGGLGGRPHCPDPGRVAVATGGALAFGALATSAVAVGGAFVAACNPCFPVSHRAGLKTFSTDMTAVNASTTARSQIRTISPSSVFDLAKMGSGVSKVVFETRASEKGLMTTGPLASPASGAQRLRQRHLLR